MKCVRCGEEQPGDSTTERVHPTGKFPAVCSECKMDTMVPFKPDPERPVLCVQCWKKSKGIQ